MAQTAGSSPSLPVCPHLARRYRPGGGLAERDKMPSRSSSARLAAFLLPLFIATALSDPNAPCYFPSGSRAVGYYPCDATAYVTACCPPGWTCYSNSLCVVTTHSTSYPNLTLGAAKRGACTNPLWNNAFCGNICLGKFHVDKGELVNPIPRLGLLTGCTTTGGDEPSGDLAACGEDRFCCAEDYASGYCDCSPSGGAFTVSSGVYQSIVGLSSTKVAGTPSYSLATSLATSSTTLNATVSSSITATPPPTEASSDSSHARTLGLGIGLGLGLPLCLAIAGLIICFKVVRPRQRDRPPRMIYQEDEHSPWPVEPPLRNPYGVNGGIPEHAQEDEYVYDSRAHVPKMAPASDPYDSTI